MQTFTYDLLASTFDGLTPVVLGAPEDYGQDQIQEISDVSVGLLNLDVSNTNTSPDQFAGNAGDRVVTQLWVRSPAPLPAGSRIAIVDVRDPSVPVLQQVVEDLSGATNRFRLIPFRVPQGSALQVLALGAELIRLEVIPNPDPVAVLTVAGDGDGDGDGDCPCLSFTGGIVTGAGATDLTVGHIQRYDATGVSPGLQAFVFPTPSGIDDQVAIKEVGNSPVDVTLDGNGALVESPSAPPAATGIVGLARAFFTWQWDGTAWRIV